ncbi:septum formation initiator [Hyphomonas sp.]|uniref:S10 family peptidase n=1 Tax=Hyphomonas sp. TaxID=87 RepID=UPI001BCEFCDA|nr:septum formation initiator [Hyphomonas sp.]
MIRFRNFVGACAAGLVLGLNACAQTGTPPAAPVDPTAPVVAETAPSAPFVAGSAPYRRVTEHSFTANGETVSYTAIAGDTWLRDMDGKPTASIFSFSYLRTDVQDGVRPVVFVFNGGPGSASLWIHMGAIGPRRVVLDADVNPSNVPPFGLEDNPYSILDVADLVFIDPVGTGFSVPLEGTDPKTFWGVDEDAESISQFIELWLSEHGRWNSPKYVLGESYGSIRAAVLPRTLMGGPIYNGLMRGITLDGIVLLGTTLDARQTGGADVPAGTQAAKQARSLPGLVVTSVFHGLVETPAGGAVEAYKAAEAYARETYEPALRAHHEGTLTPEARANVLQEITRMTGLAESDIGDDLHIDERSYAKAALRGRGLEIGMYDSRYTLPLANSGGDPVADDPAMTRYVPGFIAAFHQMIRDDLDVRLGRPYASIRWRELLFGWNWSRKGVAEGQSYATDLAWAMRRNPDLRVLVASGYYDLVTTPADARASIAAAGLPQDRVTFTDYESGHMLYLGGTAEAFSDDLRDFLKK